MKVLTNVKLLRKLQELRKIPIVKGLFISTTLLLLLCEKEEKRAMCPSHYPEKKKAAEKQKREREENASKSCFLTLRLGPPYRSRRPRLS